MISDAIISGGILICVKFMEDWIREKGHTHICTETWARLKRHMLTFSQDLNLHKTSFRNHLVMFKMIKAEIHTDSHKETIPKYLCDDLHLSICTFNVRYE